MVTLIFYTLRMVRSIWTSLVWGDGHEVWSGQSQLLVGGVEQNDRWSCSLNICNILWIQVQCTHALCRNGSAKVPQLMVILYEILLTLHAIKHTQNPPCIHASIHFLTRLSSRGSWACWSLTQPSSGSRRGTHWNGWQPTAGDRKVSIIIIMIMT